MINKHTILPTYNFADSFTGWQSTSGWQPIVTFRGPLKTNCQSNMSRPLVYSIIVLSLLYYFHLIVSMLWCRWKRMESMGRQQILQLHSPRLWGLFSTIFMLQRSLYVWCWDCQHTMWGRHASSISECYLMQTYCFGLVLRLGRNSYTV